MFSLIRNAATLHPQYNGRFLTGPYDLKSSGIKGVVFQPSTMDTSHWGGLEDQTVVQDLEKADNARRSVADNIMEGFGSIAVSGRSA